MENERLINFKKAMVLKRITKDGKELKRKIGENQSNANELMLKNVELYEPVSYQEILKMNKKKYRDLKIEILRHHLHSAITSTYYAIDLYKELKNKTEYWEKESTIDFDFKNWNKIKKVNGKLTQYYKELLEVERSLK